MPELNWGLIAPQNYLQTAIQSQRAGQQDATEAKKREALALYGRDPNAGMKAMLTVDAVEAGRLAQGHDAYQGMQAKTAAEPFLAKRDYRGAADAAAGLDPAIARRFQEMDSTDLDLTQKRGQAAGQVLMAASLIPDPEGRRRYIQERKPSLSTLFSELQIDGYDVSDPLVMRAAAGQFMNLAELAEKTTQSKQGDYIVTYSTNPVSGTRPVAKTLIPPTRDEVLARDKFGYEQGRDHVEDGYKEREVGLRESEASRPTPTRVQGEVLDKVTRGVPLTPGEQKIYNAWEARGSGGGDGEYYIEAGGQAPRGGGAPPAAKPPARGGRPGSSQASPVTPASAVEAQKLPRGTWIRDPAGNVFQK